MKPRLIVCAFIILSLTGCATLTPEETKLAVSELVTEVQVAINRIDKGSEGYPALPPLKSAELNVSSQAVRGVGASASLVVSAGGGRNESETSTITMMLVPTSEGIQATDEGRGEEIANAVLAAAEALKGLESLKLKSLIIYAELEVVKDIEGGLTVELAGLSVEAGGQKVLTTGNSLKLIFEG